MNSLVLVKAGDDFNVFVGVELKSEVELNTDETGYLDIVSKSPLAVVFDVDMMLGNILLSVVEKFNKLLREFVLEDDFGYSLTKLEVATAFVEVLVLLNPRSLCCNVRARHDATSGRRKAASSNNKVQYLFRYMR